MIESFILSLIYGRVAVTLGCWLFFAMQAGRTKRWLFVF
jgi:hypothetical protein